MLFHICTAFILAEMLKSKIFIFIVFLFSLMACHKDADRFSGNYPCCFQATIDYLLSQPTIHAKIEKYTLNDEYLYGISDTEFYYDENYPVYNGSCEVIFTVGGIGGNNCGSLCNEWMEEAEFIEIVWEDPR